MEIKKVSGLRGLMFSKKLNKNQVVLIERPKESISNSTIHMFFVFQKLKIAWLNKNKEVIDLRTAYPFLSILSPKQPAKYILEMSPQNTEIRIGSKLNF